MRNLIRNARPIANHPDIDSRQRECLAPTAYETVSTHVLYWCRRCGGDLAKCLREGGIMGADENIVDKALMACFRATSRGYWAGCGGCRRSYLWQPQRWH